MSTARELLDAVQAEPAPRDAENRLVPLIAEGTAPRSVFAAIAAEELHIVPSDWRSLHALAVRSESPTARSYFGGLDTEALDHGLARRYARLFQSYELMFWNTLADGV